MPKCLEPIAICGIGCRLPGGANDPDSLWQILINKTDTVSEIPADRWNKDVFFDPDQGHMSRTHSKWASFLESIDQFDAPFFGISSREADYVDPQQRLLMEATWEAIDDGGYVLEKIRKLSPSVYVGISTFDYSHLHVAPETANPGGPFAATGTSLSIASNRISYCFDFKGPSMSVDTACSSSLIALHLACQSIERGECQMAFVGGVNAIILPTTFIAFSNMSAAAADGHCKTFDARADGFVRCEGVGVVALRPLRDAVQDGDRIYGVVLGTGSNQDGTTPGIAHPSKESQIEIVRDTCRRAGVAPSKISYVEAHGTGTAVGDVVEANALGISVGEGRGPGEECVVGSVKTNIGHLEAGAGIAGLIKCTMMFKYGQVPPNLNFITPNPAIDFEKLNLRIPTEPEPLRGPDGSSARPIIGINSFGFGGTNAFALLQAPPPRKKPEARPAAGRSDPSEDGKTYLLPVSARSEEALTAQAASLSEYLEADGAEFSLDQICCSAGTRRTHHSHRLAVIGQTRDALVEALGAFGGETTPAACITGRPLEDARPVFVYSGQGPQWYAMGRGLYEHEPVYREKLEACHEALRSVGGWSLIDELMADEEHSRFAETSIAQPAIFALQVALTALWESWTVRPAAVVGHSVGEVAAAHVCGALDLEQAMGVIYHRGRCMGDAPCTGRMLAAGLSRDEALEMIEPYKDVVSLAAINGPSSVTLSGEQPELEALAAKLEETNRFNKFLPVEYAFHSAQMDPVRDELMAALDGLSPREATTPVVSTVEGALVEGSMFDAMYWWRNVRQTVRFAPAIEALTGEGYRLFVELAAHPVLSASIRQCLDEKELGHEATVVPSLRRDTDDRETMLQSLGSLHCLGYLLDWEAMYGSDGASWVSLPKYVWQHERYWCEMPPWRRWRLNPPTHPLLSWRRDDPIPTWHTDLDRRSLPYLNDHVVNGQIVFPAAGYVEAALGMASQVLPSGPCQLEEMEFVSPLVIPETGNNPQLQFQYDPDNHAVTIHSRINEEIDSWTLHARGRLENTDPGRRPGRLDTDAIIKGCTYEVAPEKMYDYLREIGLAYGPLFRGVDAIWGRRGEVLGWIQLQEKLADGLDKSRLHPAILDACMQLPAAIFPLEVDPAGQSVYMAASIRRIRWFEPAPANVWAHVWVSAQQADSYEYGITIATDDGRVVAQVEGYLSAAVGRASARNTGLDSYFHELQWTLRPLPEGNGSVPHRPAATFMPSVAPLTAGLQQEADTIRSGFGLTERFLQAEPDINRLCTDLVLESFEKLGWSLRSGEQVSIPEMMRAKGISPSHLAAVNLYFSWLEQDGYLRHNGTVDPGTWDVVKPLSAVTDSAASWRSLALKFPSLSADLTVLKACGNSMAEMMKGDIDPAEIRFEGAVADLLDHVSSSSALTRGANMIMADAVRGAIRDLPEGCVIRILELGGGGGGTTSHILPVLPAEQTQYLFTDVSEEAVSHAEDRFSEYRFVTCRTLDPGRDFTEQDFEEGPVDLVLAPDVLMSTADLPAMLRRVSGVLAPGGLLVLGACDPAVRSNMLVSSLFDDCWRTRNGNSNTEFASREQWLSLLSEAGLLEAHVVSETNGTTEQGQAVYLARGNRQGPEPDRPGEAESPPAVTADRWLLFGDSGGVTDRLAALLAGDGGKTVIVRTGDSYERESETRYTMDPADSGPMRDVVREVVSSGGATCKGIVYLWSLDAPVDADMRVEQLAASQPAVCHSLVSLVQALSEEVAGDHQPPLTLVTRAAQPVSLNGASLSVAQTPLIGLGRVIATEMPAMQCRRIDLPEPVGDVEIRALWSELTKADDGEDEIVLRNEARYVQRLVPAPLHDCTAESKEQTAFRLEIGQTGVLDQLSLRPLKRRMPGPHQVEIEVCAAGMNFRDVMKALGMYPRQSPDVNMLGDECAGRVTRVGEGVTEFKPGDRVVASVSGGFASHVTTYAGFVLPLPSEFTMEEGATLMVNYITAYYALHHLAHMAKGERVLIHAGAGGVGLAAVQLALAAGAEVFATAGNPVKRGFLRDLGVDHVMDSRSLAFADEVMEITKGEGIDIVLNSLAGHAILKSMELLRFNGRFLEIGKRDIYGGSEISLKPFRNALSLFAIDLQQVMHPERSGAFLEEFKKLFSEGVFRPLPHRVFPMHDAVGAFRYMAQAKHIGKIVLSNVADTPVVRPGPNSDKLQLVADGTYLITGGLRGLGLSLAEWFAERGARYLILTSRSGVTADETREVLARLEAKGVKVMAEASDAASPSDLNSLLQRAADSMPPLHGVVHSAVQLRDRTLVQLNAEDFEAAMAPKAYGAWNLHLQTQHMPLDFFVLMSSISATTGNPGQGNYAAANAFEDALAYYRRQLGLPALTVNLDMIRDIGVASRSKELREHFQRAGLHGLSPEEVHRALERLLMNGVTQMCVTSVNWGKFLRQPGLVPKTPRFEALRSAETEEDGEMGGRIRDELAMAMPEERQPLMESFIRRQVAEVLRSSPQKVDVNTRLDQLGVDSLLGVELITRLDSQLGVSVSNQQLMNTPTVAGLAENLAGRMAADQGVESAAPNEKRQEKGPDEPTVEEPAATEATQDFETDSRLVDSVHMGDRPFVPGTAVAPKTVLVTGATGFLGAYLVAELLDQTEADVHCLVRAADGESARARLLDNLKLYSLVEDESVTARLKVQVGDVTQPDLGLSGEQLVELSETMDAIYHCAATVSHLHSYAELRPGNVLGTLEILKAAAAGRPAPVHFVSSIAAVGTVLDGQGDTFTEEFCPAVGTGLTNNYGESKRVGEALVRKLAEGGLPTSIHRPGNLIGDRKTGISPPGDIVMRLVKTYILFGIAPESQTDIYFTPVDYVARAIVWLSLRESSWGKNFHQLGAHPVCLNDVMDVASSLGYKIRRMPFEEWGSLLAERGRTYGDHPLSPFLDAYPIEAVMALVDLQTTITAKATEEAVAGAGILCPPIDRDYLRACFEHFMSTGYLPRPDEHEPYVG